MARRFQFRLRTLFYMIAVVAVGCLIADFLITGYRKRERQERARIQREETMKYWDGPTPRQFQRR